MRLINSELSLSATDLAGFLACRHLTALEMGMAQGTRKRPFFEDPLLEILFARGLAHERSYVASLQGAGKRITDLSEIKNRDDALRATVEAMHGGAEVIVQGALRDGRWYGRPDIMQRLEKPSALGQW